VRRPPSMEGLCHHRAVISLLLIVPCGTAVDGSATRRARAEIDPAADSIVVLGRAR
jgi:hypothetical protein